MKRSAFSVRRDERGSVLTLAAVTLSAMLMVTAFAIDLGQVYIAKQRAQNVCDSASAAGAWELASRINSPSTGEPNAVAAANQAATSNNTVDTSWQIQKVTDSSSGVDVTFPVGTVYDDAGRAITVKDGEAIKAKGYIQVNFAFARIFSYYSQNIRAQATTIVKLTTTPAGALLGPLAVSNNTIFANGSWPGVKFGQSVTLKTGSWQSDFLGPGNFGALSMPGVGNGASAFRSALAGDYSTPPSLTLPTTISTKPGNMGNQVSKGLSSRFAKDGSQSYTYNSWLAAYNSSTGMFPFTWHIMLLPVVQDPSQPVNGRSDLNVVGLAAFFIESYNGGDLTGRFIQGVKSGDSYRWVFPNNETAQSTTTILEIRTIS